MPVLQNSKHERFAQLVAQGESYTQAYKQVYDTASIKTAECKSSLLVRNVKVAERLMELKEQFAKKSFLTFERKRALLLEMAEGKIPTKTIRSRGGDKEFEQDHYDRAKALELDAKLTGEFQEKQEVAVNWNFIQNNIIQQVNHKEAPAALDIEVIEEL